MARTSHSRREDNLIQQYFKDGYTYDEIRSFLRLRHDVELTPDQLRKRLKDMGLRRRGANIESSLEAVEEAIIVSLQFYSLMTLII